MFVFTIIWHAFHKIIGAYVNPIESHGDSSVFKIRTWHTLTWIVKKPTLPSQIHFVWEVNYVIMILIWHLSINITFF